MKKRARKTAPFDSAPAASSRGRRGAAQADVQFTQLLLVHRTGGAGEQALRALRLGERNHVADALGARHQRDETIEAERQAAVRRRAVLQRVQQEAELELCLLGADLERIE